MTSEPETFSQGRSSLSLWRDAPTWNDRRTAAIGRIKLASVEDGETLLKRMASGLRDEGYEAVIGPMDGDTWHTYRAVTQSDGSKPFLMEPTSGPHDVAAFERAGFEPVANYVSARARTSEAIGEQPKPLEGISIVNWDGNAPKDFFGEVYDLSVQSFERNAFYKPITREAFLSLYMPYVPFLKKELIFFARDGERLAGFLFGIPNYAQGAQTTTAIVKTYASKVRGTGHLLLDAFHRNALDHGYETTIHALIHADNISLQRSQSHGTEVFRRYTLFGKTP